MKGKPQHELSASSSPSQWRQANQSVGGEDLSILKEDACPCGCRPKAICIWLSKKAPVFCSENPASLIHWQPQALWAISSSNCPTQLICSVYCLATIIVCKRALSCQQNIKKDADIVTTINALLLERQATSTFVKSTFQTPGLDCTQLCRKAVQVLTTFLKWGWRHELHTGWFVNFENWVIKFCRAHSVKLLSGEWFSIRCLYISTKRASWCFRHNHFVCT